MIDPDVLRAAAAELMQALDRCTERTDECVRTLERIAQQMQLLALDATLEASRAGEQGRGLCVVAIEAQSLARRASSALQDLHRAG
jgi:methyl-accepting chemotaxis protein